MIEVIEQTIDRAKLDHDLIVPITNCGGVGDEKGIVVTVMDWCAVAINGEARWAWHSLPTIVGGICPRWLQGSPS